MVSTLIDIITSKNIEDRDRSLESVCSGLDRAALEQEGIALDAFWRTSENLYERVRALFFLYAIHRFHLPPLLDDAPGLIPFSGYEDLLNRRFVEAIDGFLDARMTHGLSDNLSSALARAYYQFALQNLADQVHRSVQSVRGNQWMFRMGHPDDHALKVDQRLIDPGGVHPVLTEQTAVRMDLSHSCWSDIFFLGMDFPEGARVLNVSIDLAVKGRDAKPQPPVEAFFRVIEEPVIRLASVDLGVMAEIHSLNDMFNFAQDYLGLLKSAVIASGIIPMGVEGSGHSLERLLERVFGPGRGFELVSNVRNIPKGSRLAVSTNLLAALTATCMRATRQTAELTGPLVEADRRIVAARAILGEWMGGSGGGWQDSGGIWPGIKVISGCAAEEGDPEYGISRGRLLPGHALMGTDEVSQETRDKLQNSLVLVHGGMAQNVGPILEMVTEKYLLRSEKEWDARQASIRLFDEILKTLKKGDIRKLGELTTEHFFGPIKTIIPWASTYYTERLIEHMRAEFSDRFWGFWMLGGMSGGGMGFIFDPAIKEEAQTRLLEVMLEEKRTLEYALPFAMDPVVYDFEINEVGSTAHLRKGEQTLMPANYYPLVLPGLIRTDPRELHPSRHAEMSRFRKACEIDPAFEAVPGAVFDYLLPSLVSDTDGGEGLDGLLNRFGFDPVQHESIRKDLKSGLIGMSQNRLAANSRIEDPGAGAVGQQPEANEADRVRGEAALAGGEVGVITLAAGAGSRWTEGAGVVKALHPFSSLGGRHRNFLEVHLAKSRQTGQACGRLPVHIITTSYLTHEPIADYLAERNNFGFDGPLILSYGNSIGLRMIPMVRDLRFQWEEMPQQILDERQQKAKENLQHALMSWAENQGEVNDYRDNVPQQCLHPVGHWYEIPNMLLNGTLIDVLRQCPDLKVLMVHNIDTLGAHLDPALLGMHLNSGAGLSFEVISRRIDDRGGGLASVDGRMRLVEGLAMPNEEDEFGLSYYNSLTTWIDVDALLGFFGLDRDQLDDHERVVEAVRKAARSLPTYITIKDVKKRWGHGQEDIYPVTQFEKLWGDMTAVGSMESRFIAVSRLRGQQLKEQSQLDGWLRDGSAAYIETLCDFVDSGCDSNPANDG
jgi:hypothetical protein